MPTSPPSITPLPTPPSRQDPTNFASRGDDFMGALPGFQAEHNALAANVYTNAVEAASSAATATAKAGEASSSATSAAGSASAATSKANEAAAAAASAAGALDQFDDRYLGAKAADPALDNDGQPLQVGAMYWNTTSTQMRVWTGSQWSVGYVPADQPIQMNPNTIRAPVAVPAGYNATSAGPITIADGITVTVENTAVWSIQ